MRSTPLCFSTPSFFFPPSFPSSLHISSFLYSFFMPAILRQFHSRQTCMVMMSMHVEPALRLFCDSALIIALLANWHGEFIWDIMTFSSTCFLIGKMPWTAEEDNRFYLLWPTSPKKSYLLYRQIPNCPGIRPWKKI